MRGRCSGIRWQSRGKLVGIALAECDHDELRRRVVSGSFDKGMGLTTTCSRFDYKMSKWLIIATLCDSVGDVGVDGLLVSGGSHCAISTHTHSPYRLSRGDVCSVLHVRDLQAARRAWLEVQAQPSRQTSDATMTNSVNPASRPMRPSCPTPSPMSSPIPYYCPAT